MEPKCECKGPGFCIRYQIEQQIYPWSLCSETPMEGFDTNSLKSERYRRKWRLNLVKEAGEGPSFAKKAVNASKAIVRATANAFRKVSLEVLKERESICNSNACGFKGENICKHPECGCPLTARRVLLGTIERPGKLEWASEACPAGYWKQVEE